jgi:hypothetical protein
MVSGFHCGSCFLTIRINFSHGFDAPIIKAGLGDSAGVFGAAFLTGNNKVLQ